jgi:hypothetical protein
MARRARVSVVLAAAPLVAVGARRHPTEIVLDVSTDVPCERVRGSAIAVAHREGIDTAPVVAASSACEGGGDLGSLVIVPSGARDADLAVRVTVALGSTTADKCVSADAECIVATRALRFTPHASIPSRSSSRPRASGAPVPARRPA